MTVLNDYRANNIRVTLITVDGPGARIDHEFSRKFDMSTINPTAKAAGTSMQVLIIIVLKFVR